MNRVELANIIHERIGGTISHRRIYQAIGLIVDQIARDLVEDQVVTARRFGTLSPHVRRPHIAHNVSTGIVRRISSKRAVKFHAHEAFEELIQQRKERFLNLGIAKPE